MTEDISLCDYEDISFSDYLAIDAMNASTLVHGLESMRQLKYVQDTGYIPQTDTRFGTALHGMVEMLPVEKFESLFEVIPDFKRHPDNVTSTGSPSSRKTRWVEEQEAEYREGIGDGIEVLNRTEYDRCVRMIRSVQDEPTAMRLIDGATKERTIVEKIDEVMCKGRLDGYLEEEGILWDVKTTSSLMRFERQVANMEYLFKIALYVLLLKESKEVVREVKLIGVIDSKRREDGKYNHCPDCVVYDIPNIVWENQYDRIKKVMQLYKQCKERGVWPGISGNRPVNVRGEVDLDIPLWSMPEDDSLVGAEEV